MSDFVSKKTQLISLFSSRLRFLLIVTFLVGFSFADDGFSSFKKSEFWSALSCLMGGDDIFSKIKTIFIVVLVVILLYFYLMCPCISLPLNLLFMCIIKAFFTICSACLSRCFGFCFERLKNSNLLRLCPWGNQRKQTEIPTDRHKVPTNASCNNEETLV